MEPKPFSLWKILLRGWKATDWEEMFANNMPNEGLVSHLCKKSLKTIIQKYNKKNKILDYMEHKSSEHKNLRENTLKSYTTMWINWKVNI